VLLLPGLSLVSMDHPEPAWRSIVVGLAASGVVSMRVDRRGLGDSEGGPAERVDFDTELAGYIAAAEGLRGRPEVDPDRLAIFGHSIGAMQAPLVAARVPVRSIVAYGTTARRFSAHMIPNARRQLALRGVSGDALTRAMAAETELADAIAGDDSSGPTQAYGRYMAYLRQLDRTDIAQAWSRYEGDVLLLHGEHDVVTDADDHRALADLLHARVRGSVELRGLSSLGHTMLRVPNPRVDLERPHDGEPTDDVAQALAAFVTR
jgi:pimeloyl-ACP methyl ester carboxylesterase